MTGTTAGDGPMFRLGLGPSRGAIDHGVKKGLGNEFMCSPHILSMDSWPMVSPGEAISLQRRNVYESPYFNTVKEVTHGTRR